MVSGTQNASIVLCTTRRKGGIPPEHDTFAHSYDRRKESWNRFRCMNDRPRINHNYVKMGMTE